jgi:hypothetical protein
MSVPSFFSALAATVHVIERCEAARSPYCKSRVLRLNSMADQG